MPLDFSTIRYEKANHRALITLNRPQVLNAFDLTMQEELKAAWDDVRRDSDVRVVILTGEGDRAFCTGIDLRGWERPEGEDHGPTDPWHAEENGSRLTARQNDVWKPVITAVNGMCCGGAFYFIDDSDIIIASENATFFDSHVSYGLVAGLEPIGLLNRVPFGEIMRIALVGLDERVSAKKAQEIGLVTEVVPLADLLATAERLAATIAAHPPLAVQGTVKAMWRALEVGRTAALELGHHYSKRGNAEEAIDALQTQLARKDRPKPRLR